MQQIKSCQDEDGQDGRFPGSEHDNEDDLEFSMARKEEPVSMLAERVEIWEEELDAQRASPTHAIFNLY